MRRRRPFARLACACTLSLAAAASLTIGGDARADAQDAGAPRVVDAGIGLVTGDISGCVESVPKGAQRPTIEESLPARGTSGWAVVLALKVTHGRGERVLPAGLDLSAAAEAKKYLQKAGFVIPSQEGAGAAQLWSTTPADDATTAVTNLDLTLVPLPPEPGRNVLHLPPLPVAIARASGEIATVCTRPHTIVVEDPIANEPEARPRDNPEPRPQREEWTALKRGLLYGGAGVLLGALLAWLIYRYVTKPKPVPPPPPPRPPWEVALEQLDEVRHAGLLDAKRHGEYFDRVSDAVRGYLGARFGAFGLESTTDEILAALRTHGAGFVRIEEGEPGAPGPAISLAEIRAFLSECDLVKFANLTPTPSQCESALVVGERIVRGTMPHGAAGAARVTTPPTAPPPPAEAPRVEDPDAAYMPPAETPRAETPRASEGDAEKGGASETSETSETPPRDGGAS